MLWSAVGVFLFSKGLVWAVSMSYLLFLFIFIIGLLIGILKSKYMFTKLAKTNIIRINNYDKERVCFWAFQKWTSYLLIIFMMSLGIFLRHSPHVPKYILSPIYMGIGLALFLSSFHYFVFLYRSKTKNTFN